jgi:hypothetical protein
MLCNTLGHLLELGPPQLHLASIYFTSPLIGKGASQVHFIFLQWANLTALSLKINEAMEALQNRTSYFEV